jgi:hypothetical protein
MAAAAATIAVAMMNIASHNGQTKRSYLSQPTLAMASPPTTTLGSAPISARP